MKRSALLGLVVLIAGASENSFGARIKDISNVRGVRENQLIGYGLVVGLNGTGDGKEEFTSKSFARMLDTMGIKLDDKSIDSKNVAAVIVTATLPPFARAGNKIDITVNSIGASSSLQGGTLLQTPLKAADQQVYAVAQGGVLTSIMAGGGQTDKGHPTAGRVPGGGMIETDMAQDFSNRKMFRLTLFDPDFTTAARLVKTINQDLGGKFATAKDAGTVDVVVPFNYEGNAVELMASVENLDVSSDTRARVVVNEKTGTVVIGEHVQISTVAISHGNLSVQVRGENSPSIRGPASLANSKEEKGERVALVKKSANVGELVKALNALGVTPKDLITILQTIKAAGALQGELEVL